MGSSSDSCYIKRLNKIRRKRASHPGICKALARILNVCVFKSLGFMRVSRTHKSIADEDPCDTLQRKRISFHAPVASAWHPYIAEICTTPPPPKKKPFSIISSDVSELMKSDIAHSGRLLLFFFTC